MAAVTHECAAGLAAWREVSGVSGSRKHSHEGSGDSRNGPKAPLCGCAGAELGKDDIPAG